MSTDTELLEHVLNDLMPVFAAVSPEQAHDATPCTDFDVEQLRRHILGWLTNFADGFADPVGQGRPGIDRFVMPNDPSADLRSAATTLISALRGGAAERPLLLGLGAMPGDVALGMILWEYQVHGWDLARATGQPWSPPAEAASRSLEFAPSMLTPDFQGPGKMFSEPVATAPDSSTFDVLLGLSGRDPAWTS